MTGSADHKQLDNLIRVRSCLDWARADATANTKPSPFRQRVVQAVARCSLDLPWWCTDWEGEEEGE